MKILLDCFYHFYKIGNKIHILYLITYVIIWFISECPHGVNLTLNQNDLAERPVDEVVLSCVIDGIAVDQLMFFWWLEHDSNMPIYTYSVIIFNRLSKHINGMIFLSI